MLRRARFKAAAPGDMPAGSPFGPGIVALVVYLHTQHMVSYARLTEILHGLFGLEVSEGATARAQLSVYPGRALAI